jgi:hypothetical protein
MNLPELRIAYCLLPLIAYVQPAIAITNSRSLPSDFTNPRLISEPHHRSITKNQNECTEGKFAVTVSAPNNNSPSYAGKIGDGVDPMTRCIFFKDVSLNITDTVGQSTKSRRTWLIIHGWLNNSESGNIKDPNDANIKKLAETVAQQRKGDRVLMLDWGEAAINKGENGSWIKEGQGSIGVYYAASWIRPVAEVAVEQLKSKYGLTGEEAANNLNIIGHSLGTLMAAEIGGIYFGLNPQGNKTGEGVPIKSIIALDPPSELSTNGSLPYNLGGYDVDGRTPAYIFKDKTLGIWSNRELRPKEIDRPKRFDRVSQFSRAFVGSKSLAGNQEFAGWAHESFQMDFGSSADAGGEHGRVVRAFDNLISQQPFKQPASTSSFLDLNDSVSHSDCNQKGFIKCNAYQKDHEGVITVDSNNLPTMVRFNQSGTFAEVRIKLNEQYSYYIDPGSPDSINKAYSVNSLGSNPQIEVNNFINSRMTRYEDVNVTLGEGRAEITTALTKNIINFIGTGEIITKDQKKWQISKTLLPVKPPRVTTRFPDAPSSIPVISTPKQFSPSLRKAIVYRVFPEFPRIDLEYWNNFKPPFSFAEIDLNGDGTRETIVLYKHRNCFNRGCYIDIFKSDNQKKSYNFISQIATARDGLQVALLPTKSYGWQDMAVRSFSYETRTIDWYAVKFNGKTYEYSSQKLARVPQNIILSEKSHSFDLGDFLSTQTATAIPTQNTRSTVIGNNPEVQKAVAEIQSVPQVKRYLQDLISPCLSGCSGYGLQLRAIRICTLVQALDVKTGGKILQSQSLISNQKVININRGDRDLMQMIYGQCKLHKRLPSDSPELNYIPTSNARQKIENLLFKSKR